MKTKLPTTLFLAGLALLCTACTTQTTEVSPAHPHGHNYKPENTQKRAAKEQQLADIRHAAQVCTGMEWYASTFSGDAKKDRHARYRISKADADVIRDLMLHKLHTVKFGNPEGLIADPAWPLSRVALRFLDGNGEVIHEFVFSQFGTGIGKDSNTDMNGYQYHRDFSLPDADYATWCKLIPSQIGDDIAQWRKEYHKG